MSPRYRVTLTEQERSELETLTRRGKTHARRFVHARALLLCDAGPHGPAWTVADVAEALGVTSRTIEHLKKRFVEDGIEAALERKPREKPPREVIFDGAFEARLLALACSDAPEGRRRWTVRLLADKAVELNLAPSVSHMTVQRVLKKTNLSLISASTGKSRRKGAPHLEQPWRMFWKSITCPMIPIIRWCAWTSLASK
jgi:transposase